MPDRAVAPDPATQRWTVGMLAFDDVEVLDLTGPFEVFSRTRLVPGPESRRGTESAPFDVFVVGQTGGEVVATGGLRITPRYGFHNAPPIDLLVVPGGFGTRKLLDHPPTLEWITTVARSAHTVSSVCTGALLLAKVGLLRERTATTHWGAYDVLASIDPTITVDRTARVVADTVVTSAGVSAGIDMAFSIVEALVGRDVADETARYIEYRRRP